MKITIMYRNMKFIFEGDYSCWFELDHKTAVHGAYKLIINADREVYADIIYNNDKKIEGYIIDSDMNSIPDNYPVEEITYHFKKLKRPGYYL